jgi:hypothetical protein
MVKKLVKEAPKTMRISGLARNSHAGVDLCAGYNRFV